MKHFKKHFCLLADSRREKTAAGARTGWKWEIQSVRGDDHRERESQKVRGRRGNVIIYHLIELLFLITDIFSHCFTFPRESEICLVIFLIDFSLPVKLF